MNSHTTRQISFTLLLLAVSAAFLWVLSPFFNAIVWAITLAILFTPINQRLIRLLGGRKTLASLLTLCLCLVIVILPVIVIGSSLISDLLHIVQQLRGGEINFHLYYQQILNALPDWLSQRLGRLGQFDPGQWVNQLSRAALQGGQQIASHSLAIGQNAFGFVVAFAIMLYLLFFLLRDGPQIARLVRNAIPLERAHTRYLLDKFSTVVRATVKGNVIIAVVQGILGAMAFWAIGIHSPVFWGVIMAILSLLPAVGAGLVWGPVAIYMLATGAIIPGLGLTAWGVFVIGLSDNVLRPILVGRDTKLPDYIVLISTLGGLAVLGIAGFILGPVIAAMFMACWALFNHQKGQQNQKNPTVQEQAPATDENTNRENPPPR